MADEQKSSPKASIVLAMIGVVGSIAVAWITTQAKFNKELNSKEAEVARLKSDTAEVARVKQDLEATERRLVEQQKELDRKLVATERRGAEQQKELDAKIGMVDDRLKRLDAQIALAQATVDKLAKASKTAFGGLFSGKKDTPVKDGETTPPK